MISFNSENLVVDWISFNIQGLTSETGVKRVANRLSSHFTPLIVIDNEFRVGYSGLKNQYNVSLRQYTKTNWVGTQIIFSGENAVYFYKLIKTGKFDWRILKLDQHSISLGRIDLCFSRTNGSDNTTKSFDAFLVDSRSQVQNHTATRHIRLEDFPNGKMLKINRRNNSLHYRIYQKDKDVRFELEFKHRQTKLVEDYLFHNQLDIFEHQLVLQFFKYSGRVLNLGSIYTDWVVDFQRKHHQLANYNSRPLITSYLDNELVNQEEEDRLFHLLQLLSFIRSLELNPFNDCKKHRIKTQLYFHLEFPLSEFVKFTGIKISNHSKREKLIMYFKKLQKLDPIVKKFSDKAFQSYVCFPYVGCENPLGNCWVIELFAAEELFYFPYPFLLPRYFLFSTHLNDRRLKFRFLKSLAVRDQEKILDLEEFFGIVNLPNKQLIKIKKNIIKLFKELFENNIIQNEIEIVLKNGKRMNQLIVKLNSSHVTQRVKHIKFHEKIKKL